MKYSSFGRTPKQHVFPEAWRLCVVINSLIYFKIWTLDMNKHPECAHGRLQPKASVLLILMMHEGVGNNATMIPALCVN